MRMRIAAAGSRAAILNFCKATMQIKDGFKELDTYLRQLSLDDNNAVWNLCVRICTAYEHKAFIDGFHYGFQLNNELK